MEEYTIYLPVDREYLKVNGTFCFTYDDAQDHLIKYQDRMQALIDATTDNRQKENLASKLISARIVQRTIN